MITPYVRRLGQFSTDMNDSEYEMYEKIVQERGELRCTSVFETGNYDIENLDQHEKVIISGQWDSCAPEKSPCMMFMAKEENDWVIHSSVSGYDVQLYGLHAVQICITDVPFMLRSLRDERTDDYIDIEFYFYRILAKELVKANRTYYTLKFYS